jgi:hypothetical protein
MSDSRRSLRADVISSDDLARTSGRRNPVRWGSYPRPSTARRGRPGTSLPVSRGGIPLLGGIDHPGTLTAARDSPKSNPRGGSDDRPSDGARVVCGRGGDVAGGGLGLRAREGAPTARRRQQRAAYGSPPAVSSRPRTRPNAPLSHACGVPALLIGRIPGLWSPPERSAPERLAVASRPGALVEVLHPEIDLDREGTPWAC